MTSEKAEDSFQKLVDSHLSHFIDGEIIDREFFDSVVSDFEEGILNASRNRYFATSVYNSDNRDALKKLLSIAKKFDGLEFNIGVLDLIAQGVLPRSEGNERITDDDKRLIRKLVELLEEPNMEQRLGPILEATIPQLKRGKSNPFAALIVDECCLVWQLLSNKTTPKYISEYNDPLLEFIQAILDDVFGPGVASARTYFN